MPMLKLEPSAAKRLVDLLATDDQFRHRFVNDTEQAILSIGHVPSSAEELSAFVKNCCTNVVLAEKPVIAKAQAEIFAMLTTGTAFIVPMLEYGRIHHAENGPRVSVRAA